MVGSGDRDGGVERWDGTTKATREQVVEEWRVHFFEKITDFLNRPYDEHTEGKLGSLVRELAEDVVNTIEQAVRANKGKGMPE